MTNLNIQQNWLDAPNGKICYFTGKKFPGRPAVVLLHGLSSNHTTWLNIMETLNNSGYNCLAPDLRGHGYSDKTIKRSLYNLDIFTDDLRAIMEQEKINDIVLAGYSFGGQIALDFTAKYQTSVKKLMLISANHAPPFKYWHLSFFTPLAAAILDLAGWLLSWQKRRVYHYYRHGKAVGYWDSVWDGLRTMPPSVNLWMLAQVVRTDLREAARLIKIPTILLYGQHDIFIAKKEARDLARAITGSQLMISKEPGHFIGSNSQDELQKILLDFLKTLT